MPARPHLSAVSDATPDYVVAGINHRTGGVALRDAVFHEAVALPALLAALKAAGLAETVAISTCDRVEIVARHADADFVRRALRRVLAERGRLDESALDPALFAAHGRAAVRHVFAVAAALDGQTVGEPQISGQVRAALDAAADSGAAGDWLQALFAAALAAAKRVRAETAIGERPVTLAAAALRVARDLFGRLDAASLLLVGDGEMGELLLRHFAGAGAKRLTVTAPVAARAERLAGMLGCHVADFARLEDALVRADIALAASGGRRLVLDEALVRSAYRRRRRRPLLIVDASVPGDVDPAVDAIDGVFRYDLGDLERVATDGRAHRRDAAEAAWRIVDAEVDAFMAGAEAAGAPARAADPGIVALRRRFEDERARVLDTVSGDGAAEATRLLVNRLLHAPSTRLRALAADDPARHDEAERALALLFNTNGPKSS
jgi:glutamyl-tRNA reductase